MTRLDQLSDSTIRNGLQSIADGIREHKWGRLTQKDADYVARLAKDVQVMANILYQVEQELHALGK